MPEQFAADMAYLVVSGAHQVHTREAVHLQVHETGRGDRAPCCGGEADLGDGPVGDRDVAADEDVVDEGRRDTEPTRAHGRLPSW